MANSSRDDHQHWKMLTKGAVEADKLMMFLLSRFLPN